MLIEHFRDSDSSLGWKEDLDPAQVYMSSIVAMELRAGCRSREQLRWLDRLMSPFESSQRIISPSHTICLRAADALRKMAILGIDRQQRRMLGNDTLIASSAREIGAALITRDTSDYSLIAKCVTLLWFPSVEEFLRAGSF